MTDTEKLYCVVGFVKGCIGSNEYICNLDVKAFKKLFDSLGIDDMLNGKKK